MTPQRIGSHYLLHEQIGQGGMGAVWRAEDTEAGVWRAVKVLRPEYGRDPAAVARFVRERTALMALRHPNVVTLHDMIVEGERLALVMDLLTEGDLDQFRLGHGGALAPGLVAELAAQVCDGLAAAHAAGIVHRDLKPGNVLMEAGRARLSDFGIARIGGDSSVTTVGMVLGTISYMAPEALTGAEPAPACDVYAAGVTLYQLLAGQLPFTGQAGTVITSHLHSAPPRLDGIPGPLWQLIAACLDKDPAARPAAAELAAALRHPQLLGEETLAHPAGPRQGDTTDPVAPNASPHTIPGIGWLSPAGPVPRRPAPSVPLPPLAAAPPAGRDALSKRRRAWGIAAAALVAAGAVAGAVAAAAGGGAAGPGSDPVTARPVAGLAGAVAGHSLSPAPSRSASKAAPRSGGHPAPPAPSASAPVAPADTAESAPPSAVPTVTVTAAAPASSAPASSAPAPSVRACSAYPSAGISFWRCNGVAWLPISCVVGENNGTAGPFNVLKASNKCGDRVWLHQYAYPRDVKSGWAYCISPSPAGAAVQTVPAKYQHPLNVQVSGNPNNCL